MFACHRMLPPPTHAPTRTRGPTTCLRLAVAEGYGEGEEGLLVAVEAVAEAQLEVVTLAPVRHLEPAGEPESVRAFSKTDARFKWRVRSAGKLEDKCGHSTLRVAHEP